MSILEIIHASAISCFFKDSSSVVAGKLMEQFRELEGSIAAGSPDFEGFWTKDSMLKVYYKNQIPYRISVYYGGAEYRFTFDNNGLSESIAILPH